jgi:branched-chain amino acid transport system substrate-binding protein
MEAGAERNVHMLKRLLGALALGTALAGGPAVAQVSDNVVKLGVMADMSGPFADQNGPGDVVGAKLAVEDFGGTVLGKPIEIVDGDPQNKTDIGLSLARRWYDVDKVDVILGPGNSAVAIAIHGIAKDKNKISIGTSAGTTELTGKACTTHGFHWVYDTYALAKATGTALARAGGDSWYFITADYAFGHSLERDAAAVVQKMGGKVVGAARAPLGTGDFSSFLLQAQASRAKVVGLANAGTDMVNAMKQASEFGITRGGQKVAGMLVLLNNIHALGLKDAQGLVFTEAFYWDQNDETRAFSKRFQARHGKPPTMMQAGMYSAAMHYLKAVKEAGTDEANAVIAAMKKLPVNDFMTKNAKIREDGRVMRDMYLLEAKKPEESKGEWDLMKVVATISAEDSARPLSESECPLVKK